MGVWIELDKTQCVNDIVSGKLDINEDNIMVVGLIDDGWVEYFNEVEMTALRFIIEEEDIKLFKKVVDK